LPGPVLSTNLSVDYPGKSGVLCDACVEVFPRQIVGLVGQSGSGKSTLALAILKLLEHTGARVRGSIELLGRELGDLTEREMRGVRGKQISLIPQSPASALNPALRLETQLREAWRAHSREPWSGQRERVLGLLARAGLSADEAWLRRFPREISVGQAQRVLIVMALLHAPALVIADEPTSALDLITQREVLDLLAGLAVERHMSLLFISHDLLAVAMLCDRIAILHAGTIVECGPAKEILLSPKHPYTQRLAAAVPSWDAIRDPTAR
jgi:ABC-type glutathione transport system ATPase component